MREAIRCARRGIGTTHPNPRVGAVVLRGGEVAARGYHERAGLAHAETRALEAAGSRAAGATLVVTLEPCAHFGRTPPCTDAILEAGIRRVVVGMLDPNPLVNGRGVARLREAGVDVAVGLREAACRALNPPYLKRLATGLPWVTLKAMVSLDGRIASDRGDSRGLGGLSEQRLVHRLRAENDAVLIGIETALRDDPLLTVRLVRGRQPLRVVLDDALRLPLDSRLVATTAEAPLVVATTSRDGARAAALAARGAGVWAFDSGPDGRVPLDPLLRRLSAAGRDAVLVEGGPTVHTSFLRLGLADHVAVGIAPLLLGGAGSPSWTRDLGRDSVADGIVVEDFRVRRLGRDAWLEGRIRREGSAGV
ncbi:MAG TPA: bifunctional diaminohydroxyphosphoribosylaminopyrimidine deaminase/5-amino-6-(5-phosphoribosylamino)uracil reductase RibD [Candidatus Eisenbacteria bacterium]